MSGEGPSKKKRKKHVNELQMSRAMPIEALTIINGQLFPLLAEKMKSSDSTYWLPTTVWLCGFLLGEDLAIEKVLESMLLPTLLSFLSVKFFPELQVEAAKALKYIASGTSKVAKLTTDKAMNSAHDALKCLLYSENDMVLSHTCCSLALLSGCKDVDIGELVYEPGLILRLHELTRNPTLDFVALRTLGNVMLGDAFSIELVIRAGLLDDLRVFLAHDNVDVCREACWIMTYIVAQKRCFFMQAIVDEDLITPLVAAVKNREFVVMEAAVWAISKATSSATFDEIKHMVSKGCIEALCDLLCCRDSGIFELCLDGLKNILKVGEKTKEIKGGSRVNPYVKHMKKIKAWTVLKVASRFYQKELMKKGLQLMLKYGTLSKSRYKQHITCPQKCSVVMRFEEEDPKL